MAVLAVQQIRARRFKLTGNHDTPATRRAYIVHSLKRPEEAETLRRIYGPGFVLIAAYSPREQRTKRLEQSIAESQHVAPPTSEQTRAAEDLVQIDERERARPLGQNVRDTFPLADLFVDASGAEAKTKAEVNRFIELAFGYAFHTPTRDEYAMYHARVAALRSSEMSRQVGAAIAGGDGDIIAVGTNDVPKYEGGLYWPPRSFEELDARDFVNGEDTSDRMKRNSLAEVVEALRKGKLLEQEAAKLGANELLTRCIPLMKNTRLMNSIEFGRAVHAEMDALTTAARCGVSVAGATLYTTTFPCHNCARHIVAAGIKRVVYIEPYAKSLASEFHDDSIAVETMQPGGYRVAFTPFVGIAPRRQTQLFEMVRRKDENGRRIQWEANTAQPRIFPPMLPYPDRESRESASFKEAFDSTDLASSQTSEKEDEQWKKAIHPITDGS
jgi:cytidine deaminase